MIYLAAPFFTASQNEALDAAEKIMDRYGIEYYSPRKQPGNFGKVSVEEKKSAARDIFFRDVFHVFNCTGMLALTDGEVYQREDGSFNIARDSGTAFEMGLLYARGLSTSVMRTDQAREVIDRLHRPPLITFSTKGHGANLMIASASRLHLPTIDHVDAFFEAASLEIEEGKFHPHFGWEPIITHVLNYNEHMRNMLDIDAVNP
jgi:nucleoside 2-deoxyribosyltransferase